MSICNGVEAIRARYLRSAGSQAHELDVMGLLTDQRARIELNWELSPRLLEGKRPSSENWRLERRLHLADHNASAEKTLEKAIARQAHWYNQIPTASGLYHHRRDKSRNIDLVHECSEGEFELIELKVRSNSPLEATLELLTYLSLYDVAQRRYLEEERAAKALLTATQLHWHVLAPRPFFEPGLNYGALADQVNRALEQLAATGVSPLRMDFAFHSFPETFVWPCPDPDLESMMAHLETVR
jgi:hypothetical protein